jgi:hypothetical protein
MTLLAFTSIYVLAAIVGTIVFALDWWAAWHNRTMLEHPPIGWKQRVRPQSRLLVQADVWEATLLGLGQVAALLLVIIPLVLGTVSSGNQRASLRGLITVSIFVATEVATATVGVIRILTRRRLIALNKIEHQRRIVTRVDLP